RLKRSVNMSFSDMIQVEKVETIPFDYLPKDYPLSLFPDSAYPSSHFLQTSEDDGLVPAGSGITIEKVVLHGEGIPLYVGREERVAVWYILGNSDIPWYDSRNDLEGHFPFALRLPIAMRAALGALTGRDRYKVLGRF